LVQSGESPAARHEFVSLDGQRYACIRNVDRLEPFLMSIVGDSDVWLFVGSNSPFTAGRADPDHAMFPYETADKLLRHADSSGAMSVFRVGRGDSAVTVWEPWRGDAGPGITRNLYKHVLGTNVVFEEINRKLGFRFIWSLSTCDRFGLVRHAALENVGKAAARIEYLDGYHMVLPAGVSAATLSRYSYLAAGYMRHEVDPDVPLAIYTLNAAVEDKPRPFESLRVTAAWSVGHADPKVVVSDRGVSAFRAGGRAQVRSEVRGEVGAYLVADAVELAPGERHEWFTVADIGLDHSALIALRERLAAPGSREGR
jgi:hypothetical protein